MRKSAKAMTRNEHDRSIELTRERLILLGIWRLWSIRVWIQMIGDHSRHPYYLGHHLDSLLFQCNLCDRLATCNVQRPLRHGLAQSHVATLRQCLGELRASWQSAFWIADLELYLRTMCACPKCRVLYIDQVLRLDYILSKGFSRFFQGVVSMRLGEMNALPTSTVIDTSIQHGGYSEFAIYC
jgi:hypothetical protein